MSPSKNDDWTQLILPNSGRKYYYNCLTGESRWNIGHEGGPYTNNINYASNPRPMHTTTPSRHNQNYHSFENGYNSTGPNRPRHYSFMTPPHKGGRQVEVPDKSLSLQQRQSLSRPQRSHQTNPRARHHRKSYSCGLIDESAGAMKRELLDLYSTSKNSLHNHMSLADDSHVVNLLQNMETESKTDSYNKDYIRLSQEYKQMEKYRSSNKDSRPVCVCCLNKSRRIDKILFPCEHICICNSCLQSSLPKHCPLCKESIRRVFDLDGNEHENYWQWIEEVSHNLDTLRALHLLLT
jgi:hypothetical protein